MNTDFLDAHFRHLEDAGRLFGSSRWANADHLYGLAAECGLKRLMMAFGMSVDPSTGTPSNSQDRVHVMENKKSNNTWDRYDAYRMGHYLASRYALPATNPFTDWDISQRYAHQSHFDQTRAHSHRQGAIAVHTLVKKAMQEGLFG
ncbi:MAG: SAM-dependent methyltransferase [Magnetococcales bacterium]|nr:SAM-dependent methyltransferase [Magnetococcales bacterium]